MDLPGLTQLGHAACALAYLAYTGMVAAQTWRHPEARRSLLALWLAAALSLAWALAGALHDHAPWVALTEVRLDALRYGAWSLVLLMLLSRAGETGARPVAVGALVAGGLLLWCLWLPSALGFTLLAVAGLVLLEQWLRHVPEDARWSIKPVAIGLAGTFIFDIYLFSQATIFQAVDAHALTARAWVHALMVPFLAWSGVRQSAWMARVRVSRQLAFQSVSAALAGAYLLFIASLGYYLRYFGGNWGQVLQMGLLVFGLACLVAVFFSGTLRAKLRVWLGKHFLRYRYDYREEWLKFTQALSSSTEPQALQLQVVKGLAGMVESPAGGLWLRAAGAPTLRQVSRWNLPPVQAAEPLDGSLAEFMRHSGWVINLAERHRHPERYPGLVLPAWLEGLDQAWLLIPLKSAGVELGFVLLCRPRTDWDVNWEVIDLLKTAATQAASFLAQVMATEALMESRKFESFNRMSAFVVHDLKNIVTQLSLMMKNARRLKDNPEFQEDMLMTVEHALERMKTMMLQLREGAEPAAGGAVGVDLSAIARQWVQLAQQRGRHIEVALEEGVTARGHEERIARVVGHLVQNALDATEHQGHMVKLVSLRYGSHACLRVEDNGVGMSEEFMRQQLFKPFQSTKTAGMGIGAYESAQYVAELGGRLTVESQQGRGTTFTLTLPLLDMSDPLQPPAATTP